MRSAWLVDIMRPPSLCVVILLCPTALCAPSNNSGSSPQLDFIAKQNHKLYFGTATNNDELNDTAYRALIDDNKMFGQITPANSMKWVSFNGGLLRIFYFEIDTVGRTQRSLLQAFSHSQLEIRLQNSQSRTPNS